MADLIGDPSLVADIRIEFETVIEWLGDQQATPGVTVTLADVDSLSTDIWGNMPVDFMEGPAAAIDAVEDYLDRIIEVIRGIVLDAPHTEP
ncbi:hypothetical protein [Nocardia carnea]|uniref:hypothetical protein n=1 Tax=Nocardia carnea TaxID=37328 RepID=UPI002456474A|nr:hypothetical protein [Nocardia carnea]